MFTRCPACQTLFRVRAETLRVAQGKVRCGRCGTQFNALDSLAEDPETLALERNVAQAAETAREEARDQDAVAQTVPVAAVSVGSVTTEAWTFAEAPETPDDETAEVLPESEVEIPPAVAPSDKQPIELENATADEAIPAETMTESVRMPGLAPEAIQEVLLGEEPAPVSWGPRIAVAGAIALLLALLGGQWVYLQRVPLYEHPQWRPVLQRMCALLACELPLPRKPEQIEVVERVVREHPRVAKALLVDLIFVSRADEVIAYPTIELRLADVSGNRVAGRRFTPADYLPAGLNARGGLPPGKPLHITLELVAPDTEVMSFQFDFL